jgi:hypothetical protein
MAAAGNRSLSEDVCSMEELDATARSGGPTILHIFEFPVRLEAALDNRESVLLIEAAGVLIASKRIEPQAP